MKAADLQVVNEIDGTIQNLLSELSTLYQTREQLFKSVTKKSSKQQSNSLDTIDLSTLDLNIDE